jgi:hypothetical protein
MRRSSGGLQTWHILSIIFLVIFGIVMMRQASMETGYKSQQIRAATMTTEALYATKTPTRIPEGYGVLETDVRGGWTPNDTSVLLEKGTLIKQDSLQTQGDLCLVELPKQNAHVWIPCTISVEVSVTSTPTNE